MTFLLQFITSYLGQASGPVFSKAQGNTQTQQTGSKAPPSQPRGVLCGMARAEHPSSWWKPKGQHMAGWGSPVCCLQRQEQPTAAAAVTQRAHESCYRQQQGWGWKTQKAPGFQSYQCFGVLFLWFLFPPPLNTISKGSFAPARRRKESDSIDKNRLPFTKLNKSQ